MSCAIIFLIIFLLNATNSTEFTNTTTPTNTTSQQINQAINTEPKYVDAIIEKLHIENANKCIYGNDPKLIDLCPEYFPNKPSKHNELTFQKIVNLNSRNLKMSRHEMVSFKCNPSCLAND